ncbi:hypothetical protein [Deinococcus sp. Leaf326]|uniref:hypothetical protein n=1 Tax=Deinococcus sp. Leaf326 TaxID=1736338 RepID=UPI0012E29B27|nr:hypothetical protein [Deinococcus sp. Leaf326]
MTDLYAQVRSVRNLYIAGMSSVADTAAELDRLMVAAQGQDARAYELACRTRAAVVRPP